MEKVKLSIVILTKNEEEMIGGCLRSAQGLGEIILVDDCSDDETLKIARKYTDRIFVYKMKDFSSQRNFGLRKARGEWIFYLDADERLTPQLRDEILSVVRNQESGIRNQSVGFLVKRRNFFLGKEMYPDKVHRLFLKKKLKGWRGKIHETPVFQGKVGELKNPLIHLTHRNILSMLRKTLDWSEIEAEIRLKAGHPPVSWWRILRVMLTEFYHQFFQKKVWRFGTEGFIEGIFQIFSIFITYARLWERQRKESLKKTYERIEKIFG